ncbi:hypothetical protein GUG74_12330, partial [Xanthomonas citri pv. citri]|nr:hypothetical protein [Xanthomonas citri pv. citri]
ALSQIQSDLATYRADFDAWAAEIDGEKAAVTAGVAQQLSQLLADVATTTAAVAQNWSDLLAAIAQSDASYAASKVQATADNAAAAQSAAQSLTAA